MSRLAIWVCLLAWTACAADSVDLGRTLKGVEDRYNRAKTLQVVFSETYTVQSRSRRTESGELFLRKPGRMRWQYREPAGKLFLSDGKNFYFYSPTANRVEKTKMKESDDMRAPLAFLLGRLDFSRDFGSYRVSRQGEDTRIVALPKSDKLPYTQVDFLVAADYHIRRLIVTGQDQSVLDFTFGREVMNPPLEDKLFRFEMPPGAELVEAGETR